jgi:hypothetical protein
MTKNILQRLAVVTTGAALSLTVVNAAPAKAALVTYDFTIHLTQVFPLVLPDSPPSGLTTGPFATGFFTYDSPTPDFVGTVNSFEEFNVDFLYGDVPSLTKESLLPPTNPRTGGRPLSPLVLSGNNELEINVSFANPAFNNPNLVSPALVIFTNPATNIKNTVITSNAPNLPEKFFSTRTGEGILKYFLRATEPQLSCSAP